MKTAKRRETFVIPLRDREVQISMRVAIIRVESRKRRDIRVGVELTAQGETQEAAESAAQKVLLDIRECESAVMIADACGGDAAGSTQNQLHLEVLVPQEADVNVNLGEGFACVKGPVRHCVVVLGSGALAISGAGGPCVLEIKDGMVDLFHVAGPMSLKAKRAKTTLYLESAANVTLKAGIRSGTVLAEPPLLVRCGQSDYQTIEGRSGNGEHDVEIVQEDGILEARIS